MSDMNYVSILIERPSLSGGRCVPLFVNEESIDCRGNSVIEQ